MGNLFVLQPFDIVTFRSSTGYEIQKQIKIKVEVLYPGTYTIHRRDERISDILKGAGGLTALAYARGASLKRPEYSGASNDSIGFLNEKNDKIKRLQSNAGDSDAVVDVAKNFNVGINLEKILLDPGSSYDLIMEEGDTISVPKQLQTIKVSGEVLSPVTIIYEKSKGFKNYISQSGGFSDRSLKRRSYILYANGSVKSTRKIIFFNNYPRVDPGAEIFVPKKADKKPTSAAEFVGIGTGLASLAIIILNLVK